MPWNMPLAEDLRPKSLDEVVGQEKVVEVLKIAVQKKHAFSFILWGPPGVGKTTLARIYADAIDINLTELSAVSAGKDEMRQAVKRGGVLFVDEIHRFNKAQQDFLLPYVERGQIILVGATTENPSFEVIAPLLSRCKVYILSELTVVQINKIIDRMGVEVGRDAREVVAEMANGDARQLIGIIESTLNLYGEVTVENLKKTLQTRLLRYDKAGDEHYNTISAFIKSMRKSDPDAALYYLARMVEAGEDPKFIARRMVVFASEDIGMAAPTALVVANEVFRACETIGYPECAINLAHGVVYLAKAPKDRRVYGGLRAAQEDVRTYGNLPIPRGLSNAPSKLMKELGYGKGEGGLPEKLKGKKYF